MSLLKRIIRTTGFEDEKKRKLFPAGERSGGTAEPISRIDSPSPSNNEGQ